jgi:ABC-type lipoprotein release transport system permease subunit
MLIQIAWRNIWRNPRRTTVILLAVVVGVWSMVFLGALMDGISDQIIRNGISTLTGSIQIHHQGYRNDPVVQNSMHGMDEAGQVLASILPSGSRWSPRIRVNAIASNARHSSGVSLVGIDFTREAPVSFTGQAPIEGRFPGPDDPYAIAIGQALAEKYGTGLGKKLVLMSQSSDGEVASRAFQIVGMYRTELEATEKTFVFISLNAARDMLKLEKGLSEICILLPDMTSAAPVAESIKAALPDTYEVHTWDEIMPMIKAHMEIARKSTLIWYLVVFIAMGFGIVNTMLMAVFERMREFGLLKALGMKPRRILCQVLTESFFLLIMGMMIGNLISLISILSIHNTGINLTAFAAGTEYVGMSRVIYPALKSVHAAIANGVVLVLGLMVSTYPALKAAGFTPVEAMAQH